MSSDQEASPPPPAADEATAEVWRLARPFDTVPWADAASDAQLLPIASSAEERRLFLAHVNARPKRFARIRTDCAALTREEQQQKVDAALRDTKHLLRQAQRAAELYLTQLEAATRHHDRRHSAALAAAEDAQRRAEAAAADAEALRAAAAADRAAAADERQQSCSEKLAKAAEIIARAQAEVLSLLS